MQPPSCAWASLEERRYPAAAKTSWARENIANHVHYNETFLVFTLKCLPIADSQLQVTLAHLPVGYALGWQNVLGPPQLLKAAFQYEMQA